MYHHDNRRLPAAIPRCSLSGCGIHFPSPVVRRPPTAITYHKSPVFTHTSPVNRHPLLTTHYPLPITRHPSPVTRHPSPVMSARHPRSPPLSRLRFSSAPSPAGRTCCCHASLSAGGSVRQHPPYPPRSASLAPARLSRRSPSRLGSGPA